MFSFILTFLLGIVLGYFSQQLLFKKKYEEIQKELEEITDIKKNEAEHIVQDARNKALAIISEAKKEREKILTDILDREQRLNQREKILDERDMNLIDREKKLNLSLKELEKKEKELKDKEQFLDTTLQKISSCSKDEALEILFQKLEKEHEIEILERIRKLRQRNEEILAQEAKEILATIIPRYTRSVVNEITTTTVNLPNEEMKGRIIGKEGRNIRHFENLTGVEIIIDETPDVVVLSSFDPIRREIAKIALEKLIKDGRIHPASIEEKVNEAKIEIEKKIEEIGRNTVYELGIFDLPLEIMILLGRLNYRYSYGQNVLQHSVELAIFARMIAEELGLDPTVAKIAGLLHDIGKSVSHEIEGNHIDIGIKILKKYNIDERIILAMRSHHETYPFATPEAYIVLAADIISAHRLGARRETTEIYLHRVQELERIASSFEEVEKSFAIAGGREVRVFVTANKISDLEIYKLAKEIALKIEKELRFPGEIKVVVIRENRAVEYAR